MDFITKIKVILGRTQNMSYLNCRKCGSKISVSSSHCENCGAETPIVCPNCKSENHPDNVICSRCRRLLEKRWTVSVHTRTSPGFAKVVAGKIFQSTKVAEGERKLVTVFFADVADYDDLSRKLRPDRIFAILENCFDLLTENVLFFGGTFGQIAGKGFMAVFGAPLAYEDHAQRACRAALKIQQQLGKLTDKIQQRYGIKIQISFGLNSGHIVVGSIEGDLTMDYSDIGSTSDIAYRVKCGAEPGSVYLSENTYKLAEGFFNFSEPEKTLAGVIPPLKLYKLIGETHLKTAFDVRAKRGLSPFVNRKQELRHLKEAYEYAAQGNLLCLSIVAESGIGKSRLLHEFKTSVLDSSARYLELKCLSHGRGIAYHPFIDFLKEKFNILDTDEGDQVKRKVKDGLKPMLADDSTTLPFLLELLSVSESGIDSLSMSPDSRKYHVMGALKTLLLTDPKRPLVLALEDLHWSDQSSEEFVNYLADKVNEAKVLIILTYRPEFVSRAGGISCEDKVRLDPFPEKESIEMIRGLLGSGNVDSELQKLIVNRTEGIPFFIEEFLKSTRELEIITIQDQRYRLSGDEGDVAIPSSVEDAIMARVDALPEAAKVVLQAASVIEREFSYSSIKKVTGYSDEDLVNSFNALRESDLVYRTAAAQEVRYAFRHALTREVVYNAMVTSARRTLHSRIGDAIESIYGAKLNEYFGILADHYLLGEDYTKAAAYAKLASKKARNTASFNSAIEYTRKRVSSLEKLPFDEHVESELIDARISVGLYYTQMNNHVEAKKAIDPIIQWTLNRGEDRKFAQINAILGTYYCFVEENFSLGLEKLTESIRVSEKLNDIVSSVTGYGWMGIALSANGEFFKALWFLEKALKINEALGVLWGVSMIKSLMSSLVYNFTGEIDLGIGTCEDALSMAEKSGDPLSKGMACGSLGMAYYYKGGLKKAEKYLTSATALLDKANYYYWEAWSHYFLGATYLEMGRYEAAEAHHLKSISVMESVGIMPSCGRLNELALAVVRIRAGAAGVDTEKLIRCFQENRFKALQGWMARLIAEVIMASDEKRLPEAENWIRTAIIADEANGMKLHQGRDYAVFARICTIQNRKREAQSYREKAIKVFDYCGAEGDLDKLRGSSSR